MARPSTVDRLVKLRELHELLRYKWSCGVPGCDGKAGHRMANGLVMPYAHARSNQLPPEGEWRAWAMVTGRGFGKTRSAAEYVKDRALREANHRVGIIAPDFSVGKNVCMEGESGLLSVLPERYVKNYNKSTAELRLTNGSLFTIFGTNTQVDAEKVRGYQFHTLWYEELATQRYGEVAWDIANYGLRLGKDPRIVVTTTPRNVSMVRRLLKTEPAVVVTRGSTLDNADNLAATTVQYLRQRYEGTTLGRQELEGELLEGVEGALWTVDMIDDHRVSEPGDFARVVVGVDPAGSHRKESDETGIVVVGLRSDHLYVIADYSGRYSPDGWATKVIEAYHLHEADLVVGERNYGGDMVESTLRARERNISYVDAKATRGKAVRAEPIVMLYQQGRVHHVGVLADLETQMTSWVPPGQFDIDERTGASVPLEPSNWSPDRMDALVWACTNLTQRRVRRITGAYGASAA